MDSKSFSIESLLSKDTKTRNNPSVSPPMHSPPHAGSPSDGKSSPGISESGSSPPPGQIMSSIVPRPGLLNIHPPISMAPMFPGHPVYAYAPHHFPMLAGSAFQSPPGMAEQAMKAAQAGIVPMDWLARTGVFLPRFGEYAGRLLTVFVLNFKIRLFKILYFFKIRRIPAHQHLRQKFLACSTKFEKI